MHPIGSWLGLTPGNLCKPYVIGSLVVPTGREADAQALVARYRDSHRLPGASTASATVLSPGGRTEATVGAS